MNILVRATNWIGDAVMSLPALRTIRERFPSARISVLARPWVADLYQDEDSIDRVIPMHTQAGWRDFSAKSKLAGALRAEKFDLAIILPNSFESAAIIRFAGIPRRVGYARDGRAFLLTDAITPPGADDIPRHERYYYLELLRRAGFIDTLPEVSEIRLGTPLIRSRGEALFAEHGIRLPIIGVSPGAAYGNAKRWLPERFAGAAKNLADSMNGSVVVFGSQSERALCEQVARLASGANLAGETTLRQFIDMTAACRIYLTNDSGAMHIASALGVPSVTIFGPTDEAGTGPTGLHARIIREPVDCAPCKLRECPIDHRCMTRVTVEKVVGVASEFIPLG